MKKLFTLLTLLVAIVTGAQAEDNVAYIGGIANGTTANIDLALTTGETREITVYSKGTNTNSITYDTDCDVQVTSAGGTSMGSTSDLGETLVTKGKTYVKTKVNEGDQVYIYFYHTSTFSNKNMTVSHGEKTKITDVAINNPTAKVGHKVLWTATLTDDVYFSFNNSLYVYAIKIIPVVKGPEITDQTIADANYMQGQTTGVAALSVTAQASNANNSLEYQWYSNTTNSTDGGTAIATGTSYTPDVSAKGVTYYYCVVTEKDGDSQVVGDPVASNIAKITVSAAEAPEISVSGAPSEAVKVGAEVILTATATGTPTPTITWYDSNNQSVATIEGTQLAYTVPTNEAGTYTFYAKASNGVEPDATSATQTIVVKEQVATPTITPNGAYFEESQEVTIESATEDAIVQYSVDNGATWTTMESKQLTITATTTIQAKATKDGLIDSETATATFTLFSPAELQPVSTATTWDWTNWNQTLELSGTTSPTNNDEYTFSDIALINGGITIPSNFNGDAIMFKGQYPVRSKKSQAGTWTIKTTVPGTLAITFSDTGSSISSGTTPAKRYLNINGVNTQYYTQRTGSSADSKTATVYVPAGDVVITSYDEDNNWQAIVVTKIVFTPIETVPVTITAAGAASFSSTQALDFSNIEGITAYKATMKTDNYVHLDEVETVPAEAGIIVKGAEGTYDVPVATGDVAELSDNLLVGTATATYTVTQDDYDNDLVYKYVKSNTTGQVGFQKAKVDNVIAVGRAYLKLTQEQAARLAGFADEEGIVTGISSIENAGVDATAPAYNLAGQKVSKSYKGIVIQNGKKVVIK